MSKLVLTSDHKIKVIEMTKTFMWDFDLEFDGDYLVYSHKEDTNKKGEVYWLDHIIFHLAKKVLKKDDTALMLFRNSCLSELSKVDSWSHPINYLFNRWTVNEQKKVTKKEVING